MSSLYPFPSSSQPEAESLSTAVPGFPDQEEDELHRTLGVERFEEILHEAGSRGGEEPGRSYGEEDFECEGETRPGEAGALRLDSPARKGLGASWKAQCGLGRKLCLPAARYPLPRRPPPVLPPHPSPTVHPPASGHSPPQDTPGPGTETSKAPWSLPHWGDPYH